MQCLVTVARYVLLDMLGGDKSAVAERHTVLLCVESGIVQRLDGVALNGFRVEILLYWNTVLEVT